MTIRKRVVGLAAVAVASALVLSACSSSGGAANNETAAPTGRGHRRRDRRHPELHDRDDHPRGPGRHVLGPDPFGREAAAAKDNITLKYSNDPAADKQATLVQNAVDSKVDAIAVTLPTRTR